MPEHFALKLCVAINRSEASAKHNVGTDNPVRVIEASEVQPRGLLGLRMIP